MPQPFHKGLGASSQHCCPCISRKCLARDENVYSRVHVPPLCGRSWLHDLPRWHAVNEPTHPNESLTCDVFFGLPLELVLQIFSNLPAHDLAKIPLLSRYSYNLTSSNTDFLATRIVTREQSRLKQAARALDPCGEDSLTALINFDSFCNAYAEYNKDTWVARNGKRDTFACLYAKRNDDDSPTYWFGCCCSANAVTKALFETQKTLEDRDLSPESPRMQNLLKRRISHAAPRLREYSVGALGSLRMHNLSPEVAQKMVEHVICQQPFGKKAWRRFNFPTRPTQGFRVI